MLTIESMPLRRFSVAEFEAMAESGVFGPDERLELLEGAVVEVQPSDPPHASTATRLSRVLHQRLTESLIRSRLSLPLARSYFAPDVAVVPFRDDFYGARHPSSSEVLLVAEVAHTTLRYDRLEKAPVYADAGIQELWLLDVGGHRLEVHTDPVDGRYRSVRLLTVEDVVVPVAFPTVEIAVVDLLGPTPA